MAKRRGKRGPSGTSKSQTPALPESYAKRLRYDGRSQTLADWAEECGIQPHVVFDRLRRGWAVRDALETEKSGGKHGFLYQWGDRWHTIEEWALEYGLNPATVRKRLQRGDSIEDAVRGVGAPTEARTLHFQGRAQSVSAWADELGIARDTIYKRLQRGSTPDEALTERRRGRTPKLIHYGGRSLSMRDWAKTLGLSKSGLTRRFQLGLPPDEAFAPKGAASRAESDAYLYRLGSRWETLGTWAVERGVDSAALARRVDAGESLESALRALERARSATGARRKAPKAARAATQGSANVRSTKKQGAGSTRAARGKAKKRPRRAR